MSEKVKNRNRAELRELAGKCVEELTDGETPREQLNVKGIKVCGILGSGEDGLCTHARATLEPHKGRILLHCGYGVKDRDEVRGSERQSILKLVYKPFVFLYRGAYNWIKRLS